MSGRYQQMFNFCLINDLPGYPDTEVGCDQGLSPIPRMLGAETKLRPVDTYIPFI